MYSDTCGTVFSYLFFCINITRLQREISVGHLRYLHTSNPLAYTEALLFKVKKKKKNLWLPWWLSGEESACQRRRRYRGFDQ